MEPVVEDRPGRVWRDWVLVAAVVGAALADALVADDTGRRLVAVAFGALLALAMLARRTHPLATVALGFGSVAAVDLASAFADRPPFAPYAGVFVVVLAFSLLRWATGRHAAIGLAIVVSVWLVSVTTEFTGVADAGGGLLVLLLAASLGAAVRYRHIARAQQLERVRFQERDLLARELHDTVAHHVSAIAIQAQAGGLLAESRDLDGAAEALEVIAEEASSTLAEMRFMVGSLRRPDGTAPVVAQRGVADIERLTAADGARGGLRIDVERRGDLDHLGAAVDAALYRVAQESITNARRHARDATRVRVLVAGDDEAVRLRVSDDGQGRLSDARSPGFGLLGMAERVTLLGGTLETGPGSEHGWTVEARIPRPGRRR